MDGRRLSRPPSKYEAGAGLGQGRREGRRDPPDRDLKRAKLDDGAEKMQDAGAEQMVPISSVLGKLLQVVVELQAGKQKLRDKASELVGDGPVGAEAMVGPRRRPTLRRQWSRWSNGPNKRSSITLN